MATKKVEYAKGADGAKALVKDITEMFDWDKVESPDSTHTIFRKNYDTDKYVGLQVTNAGTSNYPRITGLTYNGVTTYETTYVTDAMHFVALACGNGFFALCGDRSSLPSSGQYHQFAGISTCTNLLTGDKGYCSFEGLHTTFTCLSKDSSSGSYTNLATGVNATVGAAISIHEISTANVSDKVLILTALPDDHYACMEKVSFNGIPYIRLGRILVPTE